MQNSLGQDVKVWTSEWEQLTPESEIQMWDFYGLRQWISKFIPRYGKTVEAGCGLGRYVFYFSRMGIDIEGVDFSQETIDFLNEWKNRNNYDVVFKSGNILNLDYADNSLSGYISLGVIEHFIEGPKKALDEVYRVLRPGGVAIITTPSVSFYIFTQRVKKNIKNIIKKILFIKTPDETFFQYWYRPRKLKKFIENSKLKVTVCRSADLLYNFCEFGVFTDKYLKENTLGYKFSNKFETSFLRFLGSQSLTISVKVAEKMHCFMCGELTAEESSLEKYDVPICNECECKRNSKYYRKHHIVKYCRPYKINPPIMPVGKYICDFCESEYLSDRIFEDYGFCKSICNNCLKDPEINIVFANEYVKPVWRSRLKTSEGE